MATTSRGRRPAAPRVHRPQARTAERREAVLRAALEVFGRNGFHNASLHEIAMLAGMTHAGVLHHFGSKDQLLVAALRNRDGQPVAGLDAHPPPTGRPLLEHLVETVTRNAAAPGTVQAYAVLSAESVTEGHPAREYFRERFAALRARIETAVLDAVDEGGGAPVPDAAVAEAAAALVAVMDGLQVQWLLDPDGIDMPRTVQMVIDSVVAKLRSD